MGGMIVRCPCPECEPQDRLLHVLSNRPLFNPNSRALRADPATVFLRRNWEPDFYGLFVLAEFSRQDWLGKIKLNDPPANDSQETQKEIDFLLDLAETERAAFLPEIEAQNFHFPDYFLRLLMITQASHLFTFFLIKAAARTAEFLMAEYKGKYNRPRPQQLAPALMPPISGQTHPSYPNGHMTNARLIALCLTDAVPAVFAEALSELAELIGRNRERAGVHYPSDTAAGRELATQAHGILKGCIRYQELLDQAKREWQPP
jgi:PAP2 superfamily